VQKILKFIFGAGLPALNSGLVYFTLFIWLAFAVVISYLVLPTIADIYSQLGCTYLFQPECTSNPYLLAFLSFCLNSYLFLFGIGVLGIFLGRKYPKFFPAFLIMEFLYAGAWVLGGISLQYQLMGLATELPLP